MLLDDNQKVEQEETSTKKKAPKKEKEKVVPMVPEDDVVDIDLSVTKKKRFRIDGDNSRILYLNTSDFGIVTRLKDAYPKLSALAAKMHEDEFEISDDDTEYEKLDKAGTFIDNIDKKMRAEVDFIFNSNVSEVCAPDGTMYDLFNGKFRFEHIIDKLATLYGQQVRKEYSLMSARMKKHTSKYTG